MAGISNHHRLRGWDDPTRHFLIKKIVEGFRRSNSKPDSRLPITFPILVKIVHSLPFVCSSTFEAILFKTAYLLAYFGLLRVSE